MRKNMMLKQTAAWVLAAGMLVSGSAQAAEAVTEGNEVAAEVMTEEANAEGLPVEWDLTTLYPDTEAWQADYDKVMGMMDEYDSFRGTLNNAQSIYDYFQFGYYTELTRLQSKLYAYVDLGQALNAVDPVFADLEAKLNVMSVTEAQKTAFADPEIYELSLEERQEIFSDPLFADYQYALRSYVDPDSEPMGEEATNALATESMALGYPGSIYEILLYSELPDVMITMPDGTEEALTDDLYAEIVYSDEYSDEFKAEANQIILTRPIPFINTFAKLLEGNCAEAYANALLNNYETTREAALASYDVDPEVYDRLIDGSHEGAADYQRYLKAHARGLGLEEQHPYNMGTYVSDFDPGDIAYEDGVAEVAEALGVLGDEYVAKFMELIESGQVDVYPAENKETGAFETMPTNEYKPWVLFNYGGWPEDVSTIAHEMGHAMYDTLATENQPVQNQSPTIFTQEVASTTNELLYYMYKMDNAADDDEKLFYLENILSMFSGTFFVQMWYAEFEDYCYQVVESGSALDAEDLSDKWMELNELYRGDAITSYPDARYQWTEIPHFYYVYYVYQYASSVSYAASIAPAIYNGEDGAADAYLEFLKAGNSADPRELLEIAGVDIDEQDTYDAAMNFFSDLVEEYERLIDEKVGAEAATEGMTE